MNFSAFKISFQRCRCYIKTKPYLYRNHCLQCAHLFPRQSSGERARLSNSFSHAMWVGAGKHVEIDLLRLANSRCFPVQSQTFISFSYARSPKARGMIVIMIPDFFRCGVISVTQPYDIMDKGMNWVCVCLLLWFYDPKLFFSK